MPNIKYVPCSCLSEGLYLSYDKDFGGALDIAMFKLGNINESLSFRQRLRYCWYVLTKGTPYLDQVILNPEQTKELGDYLNECIKTNDIPISQKNQE